MLLIFILFIIEHKCLIIKNYEGDTKEFTELLSKLERNHICNRYFCYFCLKGNYDTLAENIKDNNTWLCPYCTGACYCTRCMRNEKILQLIAYYFSIDGNILDLELKLTSMNSIIDELFQYSVLNNTYLIIYDKNLTPSQMINKFTNFEKEKYNEKKAKEDEILKFRKYIQQLKKQKEEIHNKFICFCKEKFEIKKKYLFENNKNDKEFLNEKKIKINLNKIFNVGEYKKDGNDLNNKESFSKFEKEEDNKDDNIINDILNKNKGNTANFGGGYESKTRKKKKILYYDNKYYGRRKVKKLIRKNKSLILGNTRKYYLTKK